LVARGHAPATKDGLDLIGRRDLAKEEEHLCAQWFRTEDVGVGGKGQGTQAAGRMKEERRQMVHLPESDLYKVKLIMLASIADGTQRTQTGSERMSASSLA
jgi:hypothetical protein